MFSLLSSDYDADELRSLHVTRISQPGISPASIPESQAEPPEAPGPGRPDYDFDELKI